MIQINIGDHVSPHPGWVEVPNKWREQLRWARSNAFRITRDIPAANKYFKTLPLGRSLTDLLNDGSIWLNHDPTDPDWGATSIPHPTEVSINPLSFRWGRWSVLATLVHELAHVNGAPGGNDKRAEEAVLHCGMGRQSEKTSGKNDPFTPYNPRIGG
jgi:hypothetical protein